MSAILNVLSGTKNDIRDRKRYQNLNDTSIKIVQFVYSRDIFPVTLKTRQDDISVTSTIPFSSFEFSQVTSIFINFPSISDFLFSERSSIIFEEVKDELS